MARFRRLKPGRREIQPVTGTAANRSGSTAVPSRTEHRPTTTQHGADMGQNGSGGDSGRAQKRAKTQHVVEETSDPDPALPAAPNVAAGGGFAISAHAGAEAGAGTDAGASRSTMAAKRVTDSRGDQQAEEEEGEVEEGAGAEPPSFTVPIDPLVTATHKVFEMSIISSTSMTGKIARLLKLLASISFGEPGAKPVVAVVRAHGPAVVKAISVVEIAKAEIQKDSGGKWYQYSTVMPKEPTMKAAREARNAMAPRLQTAGGVKSSGRTIAEWERERARATVALEKDRTDDSDDDDDGEDSFERMEDIAARAGQKENPRATEEQACGSALNVPRLVVYLTRVRCPRLRTLYGEQTNDTK